MLTYNVKSVSDTGQVEREALESVLARIGSDVACLQEIRPNDDEEADLEAIAAALGYIDTYWGWKTPLGGALRNVCMSKFPIDYANSASLSSSDLSSDGLANETGRDIVQIRVQVQPGVLYLGVFTVHLKSGFADADRFRRHIEAERLGQAISAYRAVHPDDAVVVTGDFNEELGDEWVGSWTSQPDISASSFHLGSDLPFPTVYAPFSPVLDEGLLEVVATAEDNEVDFGTRISGRHIDYVFARGLIVLGSEVYKSANDNGVDDLPIGRFLEKTGAPLAADVSALSSDHYPVIVEFTF
ncbi:MAG: endonuclease/exonuclease/phosphatase family protein [Deltaproteobacteria bacterium]|nr:endonuclease/exonuclease/phosphatase family protein [Deltaproteobacteria bacterium]